MKIAPLSPSDITNNLHNIIPDVVITAVNNILTKKYRGSSINITQEEIIREIVRLDPNMNSEQLFENRWLDIEPIFRSVGWQVEFDKPAYHESYEAFFTFSIPF